MRKVVDGGGRWMRSGRGHEGRACNGGTVFLHLIAAATEDERFCFFFCATASNTHAGLFLLPIRSRPTGSFTSRLRPRQPHPILTTSPTSFLNLRTQHPLLRSYFFLCRWDRDIKVARLEGSLAWETHVLALHGGAHVCAGVHILIRKLLSSASLSFSSSSPHASAATLPAT